MKLVLHKQICNETSTKIDLYPNLVMVIEYACLLIPQLDT